MIYFMDTKTLTKKFLKNEGPETVLEAQYCIVSSRIRKTRNMDNIAIVSSLLYPSKYDVLYLENDDEIIAKYYSQLQDLRPMLFFSNIVKAFIKQGYDIVFLCTPNEYKIGYMSIMADHISKEFCIPVVEYKTGRIYDYPLNESKTLRICKEIKKNRQKQMMQTIEGRKSLVKNMSKKEKINLLKSMNLYYKGMDKEDIKETIELYFIKE